MLRLGVAQRFARFRRRRRVALPHGCRRRRGHDVFGHSGPRRLPARAKARARVPDRAGGRGHHLALRPRRPDAPHTARGRQKARHLEELCIAPELM